MSCFSVGSDPALAMTRDAPTPKNKTPEEPSLTTSPAAGSPQPTESHPQESYPTTVPGTPYLVSSPDSSFSRTCTAQSQQRSGQQSEKGEGLGGLFRSRQGSNQGEGFAGLFRGRQQSEQGDGQAGVFRSRSNNSFTEKLGRLLRRSKRKEKRTRAQRDKSARPSRPDILDKEDTSKLTKFWRSATGGESEVFSASSPPPASNLTSLPFGVPEDSEVPAGGLDFSHFAQNTQSQPAYFRRKAGMDFSRLAPQSLDGEKKQRAIQDAKDMSNRVHRTCERQNTDVPPYEFIELIGKGSFGRVYKCKEMSTNELVAIKIINTDDVDYGQSALDKDDTIRDFRKEVTIMQQLKDANAKNVNPIRNAFDLQDQLWIISDYCTGGSVKTLMRAQPPSHPGLEEQYIIPLARELALAIKSVHDIGIIHRDIKCTNVYITEEGDIQLGDFGIVGVLDDEGSKRRTVVGTPHYMAREMMISEPGTNQATEAYGTEVDIWSYGCTVYEMATGLPPNARRDGKDLGLLLVNAPRLEGGSYSQELREFVAFCLNSDPKERPTIDAILKHQYIAGTQKKYPTKALVTLIRRYKAWEYGGGWRQSLFQPGGAPPVAGNLGASDDEDFDDWNFSTSDSFNADFNQRYSQLLVDQDPSGLQLDTSAGGNLPPIITTDLTPLERLQQQFQELSANRGERSLERLWNPGSAPYELHTPVDDQGHISDLPFRNLASAAGARESHVVIDLDSAARASMDYGALTFNFDFGDMPTVKARASRAPFQDQEEDDEEDFQYGQSEEDREKRATMEWKFPTAKRATLDWTFPRSEPREPDDPDATMDLPSAGDGGDLPAGFRPKLKHTATEPVGQFRDHIHPIRPLDPTSASPIRESVRSIIDLDLAFDDPSEIPRPSTASSATGSTMTDMTSGNPFDLEEDPEQNEIDRNRFSYHKQYYSEGGQMKRSSHRSVPMHSRGNSLSSSDADLDRPSAKDEDVYEYNRKLSESMGHQLNGTLGEHDTVDLDTWPQFDRDSGFDEVRTYTDELDDMVRANGRVVPSPRQPSTFTLPGQNTIEFPQITAPHPDALLEDADPELVMSELDRLLDDFSDSLRATSRALQQHTGVYDDEDDGADSESGMESGAPGGSGDDSF